MEENQEKSDDFADYSGNLKKLRSLENHSHLYEKWLWFFIFLEKNKLNFILQIPK